MSVETRNDFNIEAFLGSVTETVMPEIGPLHAVGSGIDMPRVEGLTEVNIDKILKNHLKDTHKKKQYPTYQDFQPKPIIPEVSPIIEPVVEDIMPAIPLGPWKKPVINAPIVSELDAKRTYAKSSETPDVTIVSPKPKRARRTPQLPKVKDALSGTWETVKPSAKRVGVVLGAITVGTTVITGAIVGVAEFSSMRPVPAAAEAPKITPPEPTTETPTTEAPTTTAAPTTVAPTTTEAPKPPVKFTAKPGDMIATINIPALCENIQVYETSEHEKISGMVGSGQATIDKLIPDPAGPEICTDAEQKMPANAYKRSNRTRSNLINNQTTNPSGNINVYLPIAGHEQTVDGIPTSSYPTDAGGNFVVYGHGSTFSGPLANATSLNPGDIASVVRNDGRTYNYVMLGSEIVSGTNDTAIREYKNFFYNSTMSVYMCSDAEGRTGSDSNRYVTRWGLVSVSSSPQNNG